MQDKKITTKKNTKYKTSQTIIKSKNEIPTGDGK